MPNLELTDGSPGVSALAFATDTKAIQNVQARSTALNVSFAIDNFALPDGKTSQFGQGIAGTFYPMTLWAGQ